MLFLHNTTLYFTKCLGLNKVDRLCHISASDINPSTNKAYAVRPDGIWDDNYFAQNFGNRGSSGGGGGSFEDIVKKTIQMQQEANRPAVASLEAGLPEVANRYSGAIQRTEGQRKPLEDRYANLIGEIKGQTGQQVNRATTSTANELGRRGIVGGGLYDKEFESALNPINENSARLLKDTGISQEQGMQGLNELIAQLTGQQVTEERGIRNQIAQLQSGAASAGITGGQQQYQFETQRAEQRRQAEEAQRQQQIQNAMLQSNSDFERQQYNQTTLPTSQLQQQTLQKALNKATGGVSGGLLTNSGVRTTPTTPKPTTKPTGPQASFNNILDYNNYLTQTSAPSASFKPR